MEDLVREGLQDLITVVGIVGALVTSIVALRKQSSSEIQIAVQAYQALLESQRKELKEAQATIDAQADHIAIMETELGRKNHRIWQLLTVLAVNGIDRNEAAGQFEEDTLSH